MRMEKLTDGARGTGQRRCWPPTRCRPTPHLHTVRRPRHRPHLPRHQPPLLLLVFSTVAQQPPTQAPSVPITPPSNAPPPAPPAPTTPPLAPPVPTT
ncbi:hypothetical protein DAI22_11g165101 [Oryza sativa Japonica Group]|nr:hypothetical protein DAI22_11g165101 [Oryza sativa Japonica Group]